MQARDHSAVNWQQRQAFEGEEKESQVDDDRSVNSQDKEALEDMIETIEADLHTE